MGDENLLFSIADSQQGFFTAKQAVQCGYMRSNFYLKVASGEWIKEGRGIYKLGRYPVTDRSELVLWSLWSRNLHDEPQGVWSHETALDIHDLSDVMPAKMHMTVPLNFRRRIAIPKVLCMHYAHLKPIDIEERQGYRVTTPFRTIIDVIEETTVPDNFIAQAINQALERGLMTKKEVEIIAYANPNLALKIKRVMNDKF